MMPQPKYYTLEFEGEKVRLLRVSTVLEFTSPKPAIAMAQAKNPLKAYKRKTAGASRGTVIDEYVKESLLGRVPTLRPDYRKFYRQADKLIAQVDTSQRVWCDRLVYDLDRKYAGTFDVMAYFSWGLTLFDVKTCANKPFAAAIDDALLQTAAYAAAWWKMQGESELMRSQLRPTHIMVAFISPYSLTTIVKTDLEYLKLVEEFYRRVKAFPAMWSASHEGAG